ncbi:hypothetical protein [Aridibaculum aurantiacum]|nr:hypothetical protein [Aridibaculum aurantiacum]
MAISIIPGDIITFIKETDCLMPLYRNFTYWIDKRRWKYYFLLQALNELM